ncbi:DNA repair protein RecN [Paratissierella segnis]|uniref:DNA repair protein RecN n=1 Tax=Paratissierella segnis TaxID=2763679 RepID=A0A926EUD7_9FIRM|nr:DNA repair protein RecN [Paratissierella segnis]MBC8588428.1 DNA repair protein RecN [Paratissierella segnis]
MLKELSIKNFAIIDDLKIEFDYGLNLLTGETGSGKSIIIEALGLVLGGRSSKDLIRTGQEKAFVEALFCIDNNIKSLLSKYGFDTGEDILVISREISENYPSISRLNGRPITLNILSKITPNLVDIFGQHEHQSILNTQNHLLLIDSLGDKGHRGLLEKIDSNYEKYIDEKKKLDEMRISSAEREREIDLLKYQIEEIDNANLSPEDDFEIENNFKKYSNIQSIQMGLGNVLENLDGSDYEKDSILNLLSNCISFLNNIKSFDEDIVKYLNRFDELRYELQDLARDINYYLESLEIDEEKLIYYRDRLDLVNKLKKKYGGTIEKIFDYRNKIFDEYENLINYEKKIEEINNNLKKYEEMLTNDSILLRDKRIKIAKTLEKRLTEELKELNMTNVVFKVNFKEKDLSYNGLDDIEFLIATNPGESLKSLSKIISGGEMSRIMLGFKNILADNDKIPTLIFDEIDTGISGRTAQIVGEKICKISKNHQIISISHLPQITALADSHFKIYKQSQNGTTVTKVKKLTFDEKIQEMARLLGGVNVTETTVNHAKEMLSMSKKIKSELRK